MQLLPFSPSTLNPPVNIDANLESLKDGYRLTFEVRGAGVGEIAFSEKDGKPDRKNELWKKTCFECFFGVAHSNRYFEFNGSPSGNWALYSFEDYRAGMAEVPVQAAPHLESLEVQADSARIVWLIPYFTPILFQNVSITAVLQKKSGEMEYWALKHVGEKPDFHLRKSFAIRLF